MTWFESPKQRFFSSCALVTQFALSARHGLCDWRLNSTAILIVLSESSQNDRFLITFLKIFFRIYHRAYLLNIVHPFQRTLCLFSLFSSYFRSADFPNFKFLGFYFWPETLKFRHVKVFFLNFGFSSLFFDLIFARIWRTQLFVWQEIVIYWYLLRSSRSNASFRLQCVHILITKSRNVQVIVARNVLSRLRFSRYFFSNQRSLFYFWSSGRKYVM